MPEIPEGAKVPQDRQAPADPTMPTTVDVEIRGVALTLDLADLDDFELMTDIGRIDDGDVSRLGPALRRLVGPGKFVALMETCRDSDTNRVSLDSGSDLFMEIFSAIQDMASVPNS